MFEGPPPRQAGRRRGSRRGCDQVRSVGSVSRVNGVEALDGAGPEPARTAWPARVVALVEDVRRQEDRLALLLSLVIGAVVGLVVVAFILLTGRLAAHMYPAGG